MLEYPKIETLYDRDEDHHIVTSRLRKQEFATIKYWHITEKVDGTNVRIGLHPDGTIEFSGKTNEAQVPINLFNFLNGRLTPVVVQGAFKKDDVSGLYPEVVIFGEGYGAGIQKGGGNYRPDASFIIFDVVVDGWWLSRANVADVARKLGLPLTVPELRVIESLPASEEDLRMILEGTGESRLAIANGRVRQAEGIVARTAPQLFFNDGKPLMWKLKFKDFKGKR